MQPVDFEFRNCVLDKYLERGDGNFTYCVVTGCDAVFSGRWYVSEQQCED